MAWCQMRRVLLSSANAFMTTTYTFTIWQGRITVKKPCSADETQHLQGFRFRVMGVHGRTAATQRISIKMEELTLLAIFVFLFLSLAEWGPWALDQA
jgi:hypothetical protein